MSFFSHATAQKISSAVNGTKSAIEKFISCPVCAVLQISNKFRKIHVRPSTVQDSNVQAVLKTVQKRYS